MKTVTLLACLAACTPTAPERRGVEVSGIAELPSQDKAMLTALRMVEDEYGTSFGDLLPDTTVYWADTTCPGDGRYAVIWRGRCYHGITWSCSEMYVALSDLDPERTTGSALLHEFGHCLYMQLDANHSGCPDHSDTAFWGVINQAEVVAKNRGW
jgi:hypothetical protein